MGDTSPAELRSKLRAKDIAMTAMSDKIVALRAESAAISSQLESANQRAEMLANSLATARAEALKEAADACKGHRYGFPNEMLDICNLRKTHRNDIAAAILALIHASPAEPVTADHALERRFNSLTTGHGFALVTDESAVCDTKTAENATQTGLWQAELQKDELAQTVQEAVQPIRDAIRNSRVAGGHDE